MRVRAWRLVTRPSETRIPFRYGQACLTECPQALLELLFDVNGNLVSGYAGDCLPPLWFDKRGERTFTEQIDDMCSVISAAAAALLNAGEFKSLPEALEILWAVDKDPDHPALLHSFGQSMVERCVIDALCRDAGAPFRRLLQTGELYGESIFELFGGGVTRHVAPWARDASSNSIYIRHTVGLGDPLSDGDLADDDRLSDGRPESLEQHLRVNGIRYLKVKVGNRGVEDTDRLKQVARILKSAGVEDYKLTLDGNEQYGSIGEFVDFWESLTGLSELKHLLKNVIAIEQPVNRSAALTDDATQGLAEFSSRVPVIIDESDAALGDCLSAIELGYSGTSSKACKGITKALLNRQLIYDLQQTCERELVMTGEDLCCVGVVPLQTDLALVSVMGLNHVERNGHHYHPGLSYLAAETYDDIMASHGDLYRLRNGIPEMKIENGKINLQSVNQAGFGFSVEPAMETYAVVLASD